MAEGTLVVRRDSDRDMKFRELDVYVDEEWKATINYGRTFETRLAPGSHSVSVSNRLFKAKEDFVIRDGETVTFQGMNIMSTGVGMVFSVFGVVPYKVELERVRVPAA